MPELVLTIAVLAVLVAALVLVVYPICRIFWKFVRYTWTEQHRGPDPVFEHPRLGQFSGRDLLWWSKQSRGSEELGLCIAGDADRPDERLLDTLESRLADLDRLERIALDRLVEEEGVPRAKLRLESVDLLDSEQPELFAMEFVNVDEDRYVYRLEFRGDVITSIGIED